jgi:hypothetical protein
MDKNYLTLRALLANATGPAIPLTTLYLSDFVHIEESPTIVGDGLFNFEKLELIAKVLYGIDKLNPEGYHFTPQPLVQHFLLNPYGLDEDSLYKLSESREPKEDSPLKSPKPQKHT